MVSAEEFDKANQRAAQRQDPIAVAVRYDRRISRVVISLNTGIDIAFPPHAAQGFLGSEKWAAAQFGKRGGSVTNEAKAAASRENGRRGGRPRKVAV